jgi:predicted DNA-binding transcriptional regulator AlpA
MKAVREASKKECEKDGALPSALVNFDLLPNSAHVRLPVVKGLYGCSAATVWRGVKAGTIPEPTRLSARVTGWNVGQLRQSLVR